MSKEMVTLTNIFISFLFVSMFDAIVKFSLKYRMFVLFGYLVVILAGAWSLTQIPIDVLPDLNKPRVTVFADSE